MKHNQTIVKAKNRGKPSVPDALLVVLSVVFFIMVCVINFSETPTFFVADSYSDMLLSREMWLSKSLFPNDWVFGNQYSVIATPFVASLFYGICNDMLLSLALSSTIMTALVFLAFSYMLSDFMGFRMRLFGFLTLVTAITLSGNVEDYNGGWQYFFTIASFYACYLINIFIVFGVYIRAYRETRLSVKHYCFLVLSLALSFSSGMQSARQMATMVVPILALEFLRFCTCIKDFKSYLISRPFLYALLVFAFNAGGYVYINQLNIANHTIYGTVRFAPVGEIPEKLAECALNLFNALGLDSPAGLLGVAFSACIVIACLSFVLLYRKKNPKELTVKSFFAKASDAQASGQYLLMLLIVLMLFSVLVIFATGTFLDMYMQRRYFFTVYPLVALLVLALAGFYKNREKLLKSLICGALCLALMLNAAPTCYNALTKRNDSVYYTTARYLEENGYETVVSKWNCAEQIAVASDNRLNASFWLRVNDEIKTVNYLCSTKSLAFDNHKAVYVIRNGFEEKEFLAFCDTYGITVRELIELTDGINTITVYTTSDSIFSVSEGYLWQNE